jgi:NADH:ubiquinone oxidoreductase subunit F (NADH-binding)
VTPTSAPVWPDLAARLGPAGRLTAGWRDSDRPASLRIHVSRYGPMPTLIAGRATRLIDAVEQAGLTGRGGAGFPTGRKMRSVAGQPGQAVVVANGLESEPASGKDKALLGRAPHLVLDGAVLAAAAVGASGVHLCLSRGQDHLIAELRHAVGERANAGSDPVAVEIHELPHGYVSSSETAVISWLNGGEAKPTATPPRPFQKGVGGRPTLISNVETFAHVALIARLGPDWFRQAGAGGAAGSMLATIGGAVQAPGVYEIEAGAQIGAALALGGVYREVTAVLVGGYFGSWHEIGQVARLPLAPGPLRQIGAGPGAGVLFALPPDACGVAETARVLGWLADQSASQCGPCQFGLPAIADDFAQLASGRPNGPLHDRLHRRLEVVSGRGACAHPDGAVRLARSALSAFAADVRAHASGRLCHPARRGRPAGPALPLPSTAGLHEADRWR